MNEQRVEGAVVEIDGTPYYRIANADRMAPFFVTVVSAADHWLFASSTGALAAGRRSPDHALFPYETVDRIHDAQDRTGGKTLFLVARGANGTVPHLWEPFSDRYAGLYRVRRHLYKSLRGDRLRFEEVNEDLGLTFATTWATSEQYGFVRTAALTNHGDQPAQVRLLDGVQHLMPYGISRVMQATRSVLADAYKRNELLDSGVGLFALSAQPVDRAEPSEALLATTVWQAGLDPDAVLLSSRQLDRFRHGGVVETETLVRAERGAYFVHAALDLTPGATRTWDFVADIEQDAADVVALDAALTDADALRAAVHQDIEAGTQRLRFLVATADGEQETADAKTTARHRMNVLFNVMRGGVFDEGYRVRRETVRAFVAHYNAPVAEAHADLFDRLPKTLTIQELRAAAEAGSPQLQRLCAQYLPLHFSRRHGDPSRPWNHFTIDVRDEDGSVRHGYEGNWRDIFQNWEALGRSFPGFFEGMVTTFVNASTADGYNPYRITDDGIDWERIEPDDPWSYIGYWGDHQIIYLLRLLVQLRAHEPDRLAALLGDRRFSYANVPYRIKPYADLLRDPQDTVVYDDEEDARIAERVEAVGADGKMLWDDSGSVLLVPLAEKLLVPLLAKLTNFVPGGGIWMNTQRPEWNDANNALVGHGISVVTLFAVRRYLAFLRDLLADAGDTIELSAEVADLADAVGEAFAQFADLADRPLDASERKQMVDALGEAGSAYREQLYRDGLSGATRTVPIRAIRVMMEHALGVVDQSLHENHRDDDLVHSYNLLEIDDDGMGVEHLYPMLEGQVAALDAGVLSPEASLALLRALRTSAMYRSDQHSYRLYPDRALPGFLEKNNLPPEAVEEIPLLRTLLDVRDTSLVVRDVRGGVHFRGTFRNRDDVEATLDDLAERGYAEAVQRDRQRVLDAFEAVFNHHAYTGRSGTFFGYEGLGSIYWHMVSKLALATQETFFRAHAEGTDADTLRDLADAYYDIRAGLGGSKTPEEYGAFPTDAYSHTPGHAGAKQPGMTGQVKEDVLCRWGELGVLVEDGRIVFRPLLLRADEFLQEPTPFSFVDVHGRDQTLDLDAGTLGFTVCATPVVYRRADKLSVRVVGGDGEVTEIDGAALSPEVSAEVFGRTGTIARIEVDVPPAR
ncbi:MAG: hypothetical protein GVY18_16480 [Bacteroidetes bacterium]|nr:hypothetical protein [Bacteroidota bacterium]